MAENVVPKSMPTVRPGWNSMGDELPRESVAETKIDGRFPGGSRRGLLRPTQQIRKGPPQQDMRLWAPLTGESTKHPAMGRAGLAVAMAGDCDPRVCKRQSPGLAEAGYSRTRRVPP